MYDISCVYTNVYADVFACMCKIYISLSLSFYSYIYIYISAHISMLLHVSKNIQEIRIPLCLKSMCRCLRVHLTKSKGLWPSAGDAGTLSSSAAWRPQSRACPWGDFLRAPWGFRLGFPSASCVKLPTSNSDCWGLDVLGATTNIFIAYGILLAKSTQLSNLDILKMS